MHIILQSAITLLICPTPCSVAIGVEISDEEAEKIFSCKDAIELLKAKLHLH